MLSTVMSELLKILSQQITGRILTEQQIQSITENVIGQYFSELLPTSKRDLESQERIAAAKTHIEEATVIISGLQKDLDHQIIQLDALSQEIDERKQDVEGYRRLSEVGQEGLFVLRKEMEESIRKELLAQAEKGKFARKVTWFSSLIIATLSGVILKIYLEPIIKSMIL